MEELQSTRQKVTTLMGDVTDVEEAVVRAEHRYEGKCYAVAYVDLADNVVGRAGQLQDFQERILGDEFFDSPGDLRWNKYLYIVAGPKSLKHEGFEKAKVTIESDKEYARKRVVSEEELEVLLGAAQHFTPSTARKEFNVVGEWEKRLVAVELDELLDRPTRKEVIERIGTRLAKRVPVTDKTLTLNPADTSLAKKWLASISIDKFRSIHDGKSYRFGQVTLIVGPNGAGKTSLLEAIEYFYCGHNRRQGNSGTPRISGTLVGNVPVMASTEAGRIRARCFNWYNRDEQRAKSILSAFTRYNFLDTDAAFRLSTELEPSEIPDDLSRLLVGADASKIWDYLTKISPEVEIAHERTNIKVSDCRKNLATVQKELEDLQERPSTSKTLTEAFRAALESLQWKAPKAATPLATWDEANGFQEVISHIQAILAAGSAATSLNAISARVCELDSALAEAHPIDNDRARLEQEGRTLAEQALASERASQTVDRWLTYVNAGFSAAYARGIKARTAADTALGRIGMYANGNIPEVPEQYGTTSLDSALEGARLNVRNAAANVANLEGLSAKFGTAASMRAEAARQLREAALASFDAGHPRDDCPICRTRYLPQELIVLVDKITSALEQPSELTTITVQLSEARKNLEYWQSCEKYFEYLQQVAAAINVEKSSHCSAVPARLVELREELAKANSELETANRDWARLSGSGLTTTEHDLLRDEIFKIFSTSVDELNVLVLEEKRSKLQKAGAVIRQEEAEKRELQNRLSEQLAKVSAKAVVVGWNTRAPKDGGMNALSILKSEITSIRNRADSLQRFMTVDGETPLVDLNVGVVATDRIHSEAMQAIKIESTASASISALKQQVEQLSKQLNEALRKSANYKIATDALELLRSECSLERATQESLAVIGSQINEIFSRIHAPKEYEYVGQGETLLHTPATQEKRTLEQVSTGQRAAFALSVFLAMNRSAASAPPVILIDDPIAHIDDLNALSFLDYLRDLVVNSNRQIFFATADTRIASLFTRKFSFLGESFQTIKLARD